MVMPLPRPGPRKEAILSLIPRGAVAAEIGADHGIIAAHVLRMGLASRLVVTDISAASLEKARRLFALHGLTARASFRVADGLAALEEPVDTILIAGIGAVTVKRMLAAGLDKIDGATLVIQPNPDPPAVRRWLARNGFCITGEALALESGRFYVVIRARCGQAAYTERELLLGPVLSVEKPVLYAEYLQWRRGCLRVARTEKAKQALQWIDEELRAWQR